MVVKVTECYRYVSMLKQHEKFLPGIGVPSIVAKINQKIQYIQIPHNFRKSPLINLTITWKGIGFLLVIINELLIINIDVYFTVIGFCKVKKIITN
jgi:hypothetical protein